MNTLFKFLAILLNFLGGGALDKVLGHLESQAKTEVEKAKVNATREAVNNANSVRVITEGMQNRFFWIPWLIATIPTTIWYSWGIVDSTLWNGTILPDVSALPPMLKEYADVVWSNLFYSGAIVAGTQTISSIFTRIRGK